LGWRIAVLRDAVWLKWKYNKRRSCMLGAAFALFEWGDGRDFVDVSVYCWLVWIF